MKKWVKKAVIQKAISYLPYKKRVNYLFQKYVTRGVLLTDEYFYDRLGHTRDHLLAFRKYAKNEVPSKCLELGTGWHPIIPAGLFLSGTETIYSVDIAQNTTKEKIGKTLQKYIECQNSGRLGNFIKIDRERYEAMENILRDFKDIPFKELLDRLGMVYLIENAERLSLPDNSIDLINSNNTFEHVYPDSLIQILKEFKRIIRKDRGVMSHMIDMSDHFAHIDDTISIYNFLKFTERQWKWINNSIQPQNRLRIYDYREMFSYLKIPISEETCRTGDLNEVKLIKLSSRYADRPLKDLAVSHCHLISDMNQIG